MFIGSSIRIVGISLAFCTLASCYYPKHSASDDKFLFQQIALRVDSAAANCGSRTLDDDGINVNNCVVAAFQTGKPFYAVFWVQGIDSYIADVLYTDKVGGSLKILYYDSNPCGHGWCSPEVYERQCSDTEVKSKEGTAFVYCAELRE